MEDLRIRLFTYVHLCELPCLPLYRFREIKAWRRVGKPAVTLRVDPTH